EDVSYGGPLLIVAGVMVGYALRQRLPAYGFCGGLLINATVSVGFLFAAGQGAEPMNRGVFVRLVSLDVLSLAVYAIAWLSTRRLWFAKLDQDRQTLADTLFDLQVAFAILLEVSLIGPLTFALIIDPEPADIAVVAGGSLLGWLALAASLVATTWL